MSRGAVSLLMNRSALSMAAYECVREGLFCVSEDFQTS